MTYISTLGKAMQQAENLKVLQQQLYTLSGQLSSGKKTSLFSGLGKDVLVSQRTNATYKSIETYEINIKTADRRMTMMANALSSTRIQASNVINGLQIQTQSGNIELKSIGDLAGKARSFVTDLMNEKDGERYVFGGADALNAPLERSGTLETYNQANIDRWISGDITTDDLIESYRDKTQLNDTIVGYSAQLSSNESKSITVRLDDSTQLDYSQKANQDPVRDIVVAMNMLEQLDLALDKITREETDPVSTVTAPGGDKAEQNENFFKVFNDITRMLNSALKNLEGSESRLAQDQAVVLRVQDTHTLEKKVLEDTIDTVENVDLNSVALKISSLQVQLEASYAVTASIRGLSLANFL